MFLPDSELKEFLDHKVIQYNTKEFISSDPIQIPHRFSKKEDIEIIGFLIATLAWGNRKSIITSGERLIEMMDNAPHDFILNYQEQPLKFVHRTFNAEDLNAFFYRLHHLYTKENGLEGAFSPNSELNSSFDRIIHFRKAFTGIDFPHRTLKHLANPETGSSSKRLNMYLRWMVRKDLNGVDFGIWDNISMSELHLPLDVHTGNVARKLGILTRTQNDWKSVTEIQTKLVEMDPNDPCKYDFALFGLGAFEGF